MQILGWGLSHAITRGVDEWSVLCFWSRSGEGAPRLNRCSRSPLAFLAPGDDPFLQPLCALPDRSFLAPDVEVRGCILQC